ncbi:AAA family ATPase, partial [Candidatus Falkowbacteria bacterium]|nr:AAA family ATPase [Candidatus Falkowbacteria bacterium]
MTQATALKALKEGYNIFLTGAAGSGKTFVLNKYIDYLKKERVGVAVTASTGIAATHMNGITIHSWCGMGIRNVLSDADLRTIGRNGMLRKRLKATKVLIIDEISMLHAHQLDMVDAICRRFLDRELPFGGLQVILCGDFFQLPPVMKKEEGEMRFVFSSTSWWMAGFKVCYLNEQHRQKGDKLIDVLNMIRNGKAGESEAKLLSSRLNASIDAAIRPTRLFSHNLDVDQVNDQELRRLKGNIKLYEMRSHGNEKLSSMLRDGCLAPETLRL